ncbi:PAQR family membrane homeostasis protein TrhA [Alkanindiges illinoisensis]|uniref:Hemolysin III n=1 Tax=Alkanindiges illinoisensis TaxID=197183 RepID=A0A4Y7XG29_9GAMM|nr:hemolysin III family protein [Alkanindiges illinoisensis]TEU30636.1 hemolysin III [Alkanindiges illinoisensis]
MNSSSPMMPYNSQEERINALTHALGAVLALIAGIFLLKKGLGSLSNAQSTGLVIYSISMVVLFLASTLYHSIQSPKARTFLKQLDHSAIYLLIAGTYTPFLMISLEGFKAELLLWILWGMAGLGIIFKLFFIHQFPKVSLTAYLVMGWLAVFVLPDIYHALPPAGFFWLVAGGVSYTLGTIFYAAKKYPYTHAIWHLFVLVGAACHCWAIYTYVLS